MATYRNLKELGDNCLREWDIVYFKYDWDEFVYAVCETYLSCCWYSNEAIFTSLWMSEEEKNSLWRVVYWEFYSWSGNFPSVNDNLYYWGNKELNYQLLTKMVKHIYLLTGDSMTYYAKRSDFSSLKLNIVDSWENFIFKKNWVEVNVQINSAQLDESKLYYLESSSLSFSNIYKAMWIEDIQAFAKQHRLYFSKRFWVPMPKTRTGMVRLLQALNALSDDVPIQYKTRTGEIYNSERQLEKGEMVLINGVNYCLIEWSARLHEWALVVKTMDAWYRLKGNCKQARDTGNYFYSSSSLFEFDWNWYENKNESWIKLENWNYAENNWKYVYCVDVDAWCNKDYIQEEETTEDGTKVYYRNEFSLDWYHDGSHTDLSWWAKYRVGLEVEKHSMPPRRDLILWKADGWRLERDGSVSWGEYITPILDIDKAMDYLTKHRGIVEGGSISSSCWWHIHISVKGENNRETYRKIEWWRPVLWGLYPKRATSNRCNKDASLSQKYRDIHITWYGTCEIRIFPWLDKLVAAKFRLALIKFMLENDASTKEKALQCINDKQEEFLALLHIPFKTMESKARVLKRIFTYYELSDTTMESYIDKTKELYARKATIRERVASAVNGDEC